MILNRIVDYFVGRPLFLLGLFTLVAAPLMVASVYYGHPISEALFG
jgi:hypothetical protein